MSSTCPYARVVFPAYRSTGASWLLAPVALVLASCGVSLPPPELGAHRAEDFQQVPYPPPAALAETVPDRPKGKVVWIDGEWAFRGRTYVWQRGGWIAPPEGARFAPWYFLFTPDGRLLYAESTWYDARGRRLERLEAVVPANTPPNEVTPERATGR